MKGIIAILLGLTLCVADVCAQTIIKGDVSTTTGKEIVESAMKYVGSPYRRGRMSPTVGFDCSGFTSFIYRMQNIVLPRSSHSQYVEEKAINDCRDLKKGDLVFFSGSRVSKSRIGHVGIVTDVNRKTGEFSFIHSSSSQGVTVSHSTEAYYSKRYIGACRILEEDRKLEPFLIPQFGFAE